MAARPPRDNWFRRQMAAAACCEARSQCPCGPKRAPDPDPDPDPNPFSCVGQPDWGSDTPVMFGFTAGTLEYTDWRGTEKVLVGLDTEDGVGRTYGVLDSAAPEDTYGIVVTNVNDDGEDVGGRFALWSPEVSSNIDVTLYGPNGAAIWAGSLSWIDDPGVYRTDGEDFVLVDGQQYCVAIQAVVRGCTGQPDWGSDTPVTFGFIAGLGGDGILVGYEREYAVGIPTTVMPNEISVVMLANTDNGAVVNMWVGVDTSNDCGGDMLTLQIHDESGAVIDTRPLLRRNEYNGEFSYSNLVPSEPFNFVVGQEYCATITCGAEGRCEYSTDFEQVAPVSFGFIAERGDFGAGFGSYFGAPTTPMPSVFSGISILHDEDEDELVVEFTTDFEYYTVCEEGQQGFNFEIAAVDGSEYTDARVIEFGQDGKYVGRGGPIEFVVGQEYCVTITCRAGE